MNSFLDSFNSIPDVIESLGVTLIVLGIIGSIVKGNNNRNKNTSEMSIVVGLIMEMIGSIIRLVNDDQYLFEISLLMVGYLGLIGIYVYRIIRRRSR